MHARVDADSDVAMLGAWDASRSDALLPRSPYRQFTEALQADADRGHLFVIQLEGDGGGPVDIFVEDDIPARLKTRMERVKGEFLLSIPTGRLLVGGVEDYRSTPPNITSESSVVVVPPGDYELHCYRSSDADDYGLIMPSNAEFEEVIGTEDFRRYRRSERRTLLGYLLLLLLPVFAQYVGWLLSGIGTVLLLAAFFHAREKLLGRDERYLRARQLEGQLVSNAQDKATPFFALRLKLRGAGGPTVGGTVDLAAGSSG